MATTDYPMRRWVFEDSAGRYDIDLGDSHVQVRRLSQLRAPADIELGYGVDRGGPRLRGQVAELYGGSPDSVLVTHGAQEALYLVYATLLRPGDQVITFRPGWQQSWDAPARLGCRVDAVALGPDFALDVDAAVAAAGPGLRLVVVNTPCNPTGRAAGRDELSALLALVERYDGYLLLDEEYALDLRGSAAVAGDRVISVSGLSKVYGLPGLRVGWMYGPPEVVAACTREKHLTSIANSVLCEELASGVLDDRELFLKEYRRLTSGGLEQLTDWAAGRAEVRLVPPDGTPFAWLHLTDRRSSMEFCRRVLDRGVLLMPAETLGGSGGFRLCFAREPQELAAGLRRIDRVLDDSARLPTTKTALDRTEV